MTHRVAIVGAGIGAQHLAAYLTLPEFFTVTCICDMDAERAEALAAPTGLAVETSLGRVLADPEIDIIDICLPPHMHVDTCLSVLDAGKVAICEKPFATSLAQIDRLRERLEITDGQLFPVFQYRYGLGTAQLRALIDAGIAGRCYAGTLETHWDRDTEYYSVDWRGTWAGEQGGALLGHAIHIHDLLCDILGPVERIFADLATSVNDIETEDCAALALRMASGALVTSSVTLGAAGNSSRLRLMFEGFTVESDHTAYAPASATWQFTARDPRKQSQIDSIVAAIHPPLNGFAGLLSEVAKALNGKPSRAVTFEDGRRSIEIVTAAYQSARDGIAIDLPLSPSSPLYETWRP